MLQMHFVNDFSYIEWMVYDKSFTCYPTQKWHLIHSGQCEIFTLKWLNRIIFAADYKKNIAFNDGESML